MSSDDSFGTGRSRSPTISADDSTAALILLSEDAEGGSNVPFDFSDDDDDFLYGTSESTAPTQPIHGKSRINHSMFRVNLFKMTIF